ncbi:ImmA/IrrE family metallo-endopeptidase [Pseudonocardia sp. TRM90224]|uniref:ImmA/IrrE family metallo-endopeptidase n=1 Tax=Pseudonocardia sp. TRM90224 TaxID=2812678 RepID=UPI001E4627BB|nr:ImmA/IrrE family metallo-endopeptidase [Pseudonocardia sp. TRM90224]
MTVTAHAKRITAAIPHDAAAGLAADPLRALQRQGYHVTPVPELQQERGTGGWCDGMSFHRHGTILYVPTDSNRQNFTILHEFAHGLVDHDDAALDWVHEQDKPADALEQLCNEIASRLLLPDALLDAVIGSGTPEAVHLRRLADTTAASQEVCAIALARRLPCSGMVLITDLNRHEVVRAAVRGELHVRPRPGDPVPAVHPLRRLQPGASMRTRSFWSPPWADDRQTLYLDACAGTSRTYALMVVSDLWQLDNLHLHPGEHTPARRPEGHRRCPCGFLGTVNGYPCPDCNHQFCPRCHECDCRRRDATLLACSECFRSVAARAVIDGRCSDCR